ncbi:hypothetical protein B0T19DRAFT_437983 [Cercophora scortea]|uniref:Uncharacterized protein n=1 Tax=Cercophora scortea TaxID=314031 RepID=A0AAE0J5M4_9PEZI|nr:hypothetical protein B0T19DRAFT_437983 [Cercophora scortea]
MGDNAPAGGPSENGRAKGKGKEMEKETERKSHDEHEPSQDDALLSRIAKSARSLPTSALFSGPPPADGLAGLGSNAKGEGSRSGQGVSAAAASESSLQQARTGPLTGEAIRPGQTQEHMAREEESFAAFLDSTDTFLPSEESMWPTTSLPAMEHSSPAAAMGARGVASVAEQEAHDGEDVVALLSSHSHAELEPYHDEGETTASLGDLSSLRRALFGDEAPGHGGMAPMAWDNALNFIPEFLRGGWADEASLHMGTPEVGEAWQTWVDQWSRVLTDYHDEVWGDLGSLVEQARAEVKALEEAAAHPIPNQKVSEPTALLRLRAILGHLRG